MKTKDIIIIILAVGIAILGTYVFMQSMSQQKDTPLKSVEVTSFDECVAVSGVVMESYPRQCHYNGKSFTEEVDTSGTSDSNQKPIGGDKDEHGCIGSAGHTWCELKSKCLRAWEENCEEDKKEAITSAMADKYNKDESEVTITISKEEGDYVRGGVEFAPGGMGNAGMMLATKVDGEWKIVYDGHGVADCDELINGYGFPVRVLTGICE